MIVAADGAVVGRGRTRPGGRPHAETEALVAAGARARDATAYVTLEPCAHHGMTPPCADALLAAGIARVVGGARDPDGRVDGRGFARLRDGGVAVETGLLAADTDDLIAGFRSRVVRGRPLVTLKLASSLDGRIATRTGESRWITGADSRRAVHRARAEHDAVLVGIGTALVDDPALTVRLDGARSRPIVRAVADTRLRLPPASRLVAGACEHPLWILHGPDADAARASALARAGARLIPVPDPSAPASLLAVLGAAGLNAVFVEGGAILAAALLRARLVDRLLWFAAPLLIGGDGLPASASLAVERLDAAARFRLLDIGRSGPDMTLSASIEAG